MRVKIPPWVYDALQDKRPDQTNWVTGGLGSGKTTGSALWHIQRCFDNPQAKVSWIIGPTFAKLNTIYIPAFVEAFERFYGMIEGRDYALRGGGSRPPEIHIHKTGQVILGQSANKWQLMIGENISHWSATECGYFQDVKWFERAQFRARSNKSNIIQGLGEGTPEGLENCFAELANFEGEDLDRKFKRIQLWTDDNAKHLPDGYVEKLIRTLAHDPGKLESYRFGRFVAFTKGTAYWEFFHSRNVVLNVSVSPRLPILLAWDFNASPLAWVACQKQKHCTKTFHEYHRYVALAESSGHSRGILDGCAEFIDQFPPHIYGETPIHIYGDPSGYFASHKVPSDDYDQILQYLAPRYRTVTVEAKHKAPSIKARLERHNALLAYEKFVIAAWLRQTINSHAKTSIKPGTWIIEKPAHEDWTHYADACGYMLFEETATDDITDNDYDRVFGFNL